MTRLLRLSLVLLSGLAAAACGGDGGGGPTGPTRAQVAGRYAVCALTFTPAGALASVDLLGTAIETTGTQAQLRVDPGTAIQLAYTPRGAFVERFVNGTYDLGGSRATLRFSDATARSALLLPDRLELDFQSAPQVLSTTSSSAYNVPRARYAELTGQSEANLAQQIEGRLSATFRLNSCS